MSKPLEALRKALLDTHHAGRIELMLDLGRKAKKDAAALALVDALAAGDVFERRMAVLALHTLQDGGRLLPFTRDESRSLRSFAFTLVPRVCSDIEALEALKVAYSLRRDPELVRQLACRGRRPVVDAYLDWLSARPGLHDFADLVPFATTGGVRRHLERALARPSHTFWSRLARSAPAALGDVLAERLAAVPGEPDAVTRQLIEAHTAAIVEGAPDQGLRLLDLLLARGIRSRIQSLRALGRTRPVETLALIERHDLREPAHLFARTAGRFDAEAIRRIVRRHPLLLGYAEKLAEDLPAELIDAAVAAWCEVLEQHPTWGFALLDRIHAPELRRRAYERWSVAARDSGGVIAIGRVERLPADLRELEGRRHVAEVISLHTQPERRILYAKFLPWAEAEKVIAAYLGHPEGAMRGVALSVLLAIPGLRPAEPELADRALGLVTARKNEQDPVRATMLQALVAWPRAVWRTEHVPIIGRILRDALDAGDLSHGTAQLAEALLVRTFRLDPKAASTWLATFIKERGTIYNARLGAHLSDDDVRAAAAELLALAKTWSARERSGELLALAESLGERLKLVPGLAELVEKTGRESSWAYYAYRCAAILRAHDTPRFEAGLAAMLRRWFDMGWESEILSLAAPTRPGRRQPPLHPELVEAIEKIARGRGRNELIVQAVTVLRVRAPQHFDAILGDLLRRDESYVCIPVVHWHLHKRRQDLLGPFLGHRVIKGRFATGKAAWLLPFDRGFHRWTPAQNVEFSRSLSAVALDRDRDTPTVWRCSAILAALDSAPMDTLASLASDPRPAVQERAIRVMARCDRGQCVPVLLECLGDARARIAIYGFRRALKDQMPERALAILRGVAMHKVTVAKEIVRMLGELRADAAYDQLLTLEAGDLHRDVRIALLRALWDHLDREKTWAIFAAAVRGSDWVMASRLGDIPADRLTRESDRRLSGLLGQVLERPEPEARIDLLRRAAFLSVSDPERSFLFACASRLRSLYDDEVTAAMNAILYRSTEDDLQRFPLLLAAAMDDPRALHVAIDTLLAVPVKTRASWIGAARAAEAKLAADPRRAPLRVRVAAAAMTGPELGAWIAALGASQPLSADVMDACRAAVHAVPVEDLGALLDTLAASLSASVRRVAVWALQRDAGPERGWSPERLARLAALRADGSPEVAGAADALFPPREMVR